MGQFAMYVRTRGIAVMSLVRMYIAIYRNSLLYALKKQGRIIAYEEIL